MIDHRKLLLLQICLLHFLACASKSTHPGHLNPFGSSGPFSQIEQIIDDVPDPIGFFENYVAKSRPVLFRQALAKDPHLSLWNSDDNLKKIFLNNEEDVHVETRKKESRKQNILAMTMTQFLQRYQKEELYLVEEVPNLLRPYFTVPKCLQCPPAIDTFQVAMLWFSSGNTSSVLHTDDYDNINCVLQGDKHFVLVDPHAHKNVASEVIDNPAGSFSSMDVDRVDYDKYSSLDSADVHYYRMKLSQGDCLFIPALWLHQVRSDSRNIAVNYWLDHHRAQNARVDETTCPVTAQSTLITLESIRWPKASNSLEQLKNYMFDLVDDDHTDFKQWTEQFSSEVSFDLQSNVQTITLFAEFFNLVDTNSNGFVTFTEVESLFDSDNGLIAYEILQDVLDIIETKGDAADRLNGTRLDGIADEINYDTSHVNDTSSGDDEDDGSDALGHEDL